MILGRQRLLPEPFVTVIRRDKKASANDLVTALTPFIDLLRNQGEDEAVAHLSAARDKLSGSQMGSTEFTQAVEAVFDAFEGDLELAAYTLQRKSAKAGEWTEAEELSNVSSRVLSLARRFRS